MRQDLATEPVTIIRPMSSDRAHVWQELYEFRQVFRAMVVRNIRLQFGAKYLTYLWPIMQPLTVMAAFLFLRRMTNSDSEVAIGYGPYIFSGLVLWNYFVKTTTDVSGALKRESSVIKKVFFARVVVPAVPVVQNLFNLAIAFFALIVIGIFFGHYPSWQIVFLPLVILQMMLISFGLGCIWTGLALLAEDIDQFFTLVLYIGLFVSPVVFAPRYGDSLGAWVMKLNPLTGSLMGFRACWFGEIAFPYESFLYSFLFSAFVFIIGLRTFRRIESFLVDRL